MYASGLHSISCLKETRRRASETIGGISAKLVMPCETGYFPILVRSLATVLNVHYAFVSEFSFTQPWKAHTVSRWIGDRFGDNYEYLLQHTPCLEVANGSTCFYPLALQRLFPRDQDIFDLGGESYLGVPIKSSTGHVIGHLAIMDTSPMSNEAYLRMVVKFFARRCAEELECYQRAKGN